ncbi:GyrI-like domain-containing protein [Vibrio taketomensis]|uniref:GyrI-like domain-containing protein n=1 Tax=Vibrio taketomensis TaxID=2572923 RepID=UPI001389D6B6|nr:GyrI-like domain-containing protein [Vibrio taketomensis]
MTVKHEWRKHEKSTYLPKNKPEMINVPAFNFITISGQGNPNDDGFSERVGALYSVAYSLKMGLKKSKHKPEGYCDFTVYPLEGVWDITDEAKKTFNGTINKDDLVYKLMVRQPDFINDVLFDQAISQVKAAKPSEYLSSISFETISEGCSVQMLHLGRFEDEPASFSVMEAFAEANGLTRISKVHREIYLSDARRVSPEKYRTILRFSVKPQSPV